MQPPPPDPAAEALASVLPFVHSTQRIGWVQVVVSIILFGALALYLLSLEGDAFGWGIAVLVAGVFVPLGIADHVRKKHEREILPIVARAFGLTHYKSPAGFITNLPNVFIPKGGRNSADDQMSGELAGRRFSFTEVKTETGGKNSRVLFQGVVIEVANTRNLPPFVIASTKETKGFLFLNGNVNVDGMEQLLGASDASGSYFALWTAPGAEAARMKGLQAFLDRMLEIGPQILGQSTLYSVTATPSAILVAIRHKRDLFRIGGLLADEERVMRDIRHAATEFSHPIRLVTEVLRAEDALLSAQKGTP